MKKISFFPRGGFTLMETLLAIALVGTLLSLFLTVFVPARGMVQQALTRQDAERITGILRAEMSFLRADEEAPAAANASSDNSYLSTFDKSFFWLRKSSKPSSSIVIFSYRADMSKTPRADGSFPSVPAAKSVPGKNSQLVSMACPMDDKIHKDDIPNAVGPVFLVRMTQLEEKKNGEFKEVNTPGTIAAASSPDKFCSTPGDRDAWGGVVFYRADFFLMNPPNPARYKGKTWKQLGRPLFSANLSFHR